MRTATSNGARAASDKRESHYLSRMRHHGEKYEEFHRPSVELLVNLIYTCDVIQTHFARRVEAHKLSLGAFNALMILSRFEEAGCPMHELGELLLVSRANITGLADCLERRGLVERINSPADRRVRLIRLTKAGRKLLETILPGHYARVRELLKGISDKDKLALSGLLTR
ncbi:MAG: MarR family transcriptional regulator, negative regulator of the multidrug operon emrRAB, partial [Acidobacteriota bacterium]|nr:MarR family transcriptional regulator, negative regulator of the multidrug operon emrRAB [Acidobacteriota bacterium]